MSACLTRPTLTISVDLEYDVGQAAPLAGQRALEELTGRLLALFGRFEMPATWAVADPAISAARGRVAAHACHELALLGDPSWVGREAGRARFARELERRTKRARNEGLPIHTLVLKTVLPIDHCDLVIKEGIVAARHASAVHMAGSPRRLQPCSRPPFHRRLPPDPSRGHPS